MGYQARIIALKAVQACRGRIARRAWIVALVFSFVTASVLSAVTPSVSAAPLQTAAASHDAGDAHAMHEAPCDHGQDCKCHGKAAPACCSYSAPAAAIWTSAQPLPSFENARCAEAADMRAVRTAVDPPTPPPRSVLS